MDQFKRTPLADVLISQLSGRHEEIPEIYKAWLGIYAILLKIKPLASAVAMYEIVDSGEVIIPEHVSLYLSILEDSAEARLASEIAELFDAPEMKGRKNCSLKLLKRCCEENKEFFPCGAGDDLVERMNSLITEYKQSSIYLARNKQLAHHDLSQIFGDNPIVIELKKAFATVDRLYSIVVEVGVRLFPENRETFETMANYSDYSERFRKAIIALSKCEPEEVPS